MLDGTKPDFLIETYIRCSQDALWSALTDPGEVAHYHFASTAARGRLDAPGDAMDFLMPDGSSMLVTRVRAIDPKTRIDVAFEPEWGEDRAASRCVYLIEPQGDACKLTIEHYAIPAGQQGLRDGWARLVSGLKTHLETGQDGRFGLPGTGR